MSARSPLSLDAPNLEGLLRHALAHLALDEATAGRPVPRWFHEGFAVQFAGEDGGGLRRDARPRRVSRAGSSARADRSAVPSDAPEGSPRLRRGRGFHALLGARRLADLASRLHGGAPWKAALASTGEGTALELSWRKEMARRYSFLPVLVGSILLWCAVAAVVLARRARARRLRDHLVTRRENGERRARIARAAARRAPEEPRGGRVLDDEALHEPVPPDPEVPRVEHDGRWYTLH